MTLCSLMFSLQCMAALGSVPWLLKIAVFMKGNGSPADILPSSPSTINVRRSGTEDAAWQEFNLYDQRRRLVGAVLWLVLFNSMLYELQVVFQWTTVSCGDTAVLCTQTRQGILPPMLLLTPAEVTLWSRIKNVQYVWCQEKFLIFSDTISS